MTMWSERDCAVALVLSAGSPATAATVTGNVAHFNELNREFVDAGPLDPSADKIGRQCGGRGEIDGRKVSTLH